MLFNSYEFIFLFLPIVWLGYQVLTRSGESGAAVCWLTLASLFFYGYWNPRVLVLLLITVAVTRAISRLLIATVGQPVWRRKGLLIVGLAFNLGMLGYYKYTNFLVDNLNAALGLQIFIDRIILPIGISFYTFEQLAFLVDSYRGETERGTFGRYLLAVTFFPQLIAGPIVHAKEMMPQFARVDREGLADKLAVGLTIFAIGLFKKVVIADTVAVYSDDLFEQATHGIAPMLIESWVGVLAYAFQIYFDFSAYSDMAIGLGWMFGIRIPINFASPYKATSITDFWQRWHISLSRWLRAYLYIPLGGNRRGVRRQYVNLFLTMLLGGIWHGAGWTFVLWGALHGAFLIINRLWRQWRGTAQVARHVWPARLLTFLCVVIAWVPFRAPNLASTFEVYSGMLGLNGVMLPPAASGIVALAPNLFGALGAQVGPSIFADGGIGALWLVPLFGVVWVLPNTQEWMGAAGPGLPTKGYPATVITDRARKWAWRPSAIYGVALAVLLVISIAEITDESPFIYFQF
jgi:alginate O-acetyltransferase complex protein AlgI